jgi:hypothetical protein
MSASTPSGNSRSMVTTSIGSSLKFERRESINLLLVGFVRIETDYNWEMNANVAKGNTSISDLTRPAQTDRI